MTLSSPILRNNRTHCGQKIESIHRHDFRSWLSITAMTISAAPVRAGSVRPSWRRWKRLAPQFATAETFAQRLTTGWRPSRRDYADAPLLTDWRTP